MTLLEAVVAESDLKTAVYALAGVLVGAWGVIVALARVLWNTNDKHAKTLDDLRKEYDARLKAEQDSRRADVEALHKARHEERTADGERSLEQLERLIEALSGVEKLRKNMEAYVDADDRTDRRGEGRGSAGR